MSDLIKRKLTITFLDGTQSHHTNKDNAWYLEESFIKITYKHTGETLFLYPYNFIKKIEENGMK